MSFLDGKPRVATEKDCAGPWSGGKSGEHFRCAFCGHKFVVGDRWRCLYTNHTKAWGNPLVCAGCDDADEALIGKWAEMHKEAATRFWWFTRRYD